MVQIGVDIFASSYPHFSPPHLEKKRLYQSGSISFFLHLQFSFLKSGSEIKEHSIILEQWL